MRTPSQIPYFATTALILAIIHNSAGFSISHTVTKSASALYLEAPESTSRRAFVSKASVLASSVAIATVVSPSLASAAAPTQKKALIADLTESRDKLESIPDLLQQSEWEKVRQVLKTPPVNQLWNLGDSQNTLVKLAKETGDFELLEMKDELAISLQMCDQYAYDNVFVYFQPGNGKFKVKEPTDMARKALSQLKEALDFLDSA